MKYRKKPIVVEVIQWTGENFEEVSDFAYSEGIESVSSRGRVLCIVTLEGEMQAWAGDYIIKGIWGEVYPCKPDIFTATYEAVE